MGLAASQARFLALTARKANCEYRSMQLAQDKLSITRQLSEATNDYQNSLNATKLVWDYDGQSDNIQNLSYSLLTTPSAFNNYNPYLLTTRTGKVVLAGGLAAAAEAAGIAQDGSTGRAENDGDTTAHGGSYTDFIEALCEEGVIDETTRDGILEASQATYYKYKDSTTGLTTILTPEVAENCGVTLKTAQKKTITINGVEIEVAANLSDSQLDKIKSGLNIDNINIVGKAYDKDTGYGAAQLNKDYVSGNNIVALANQLGRLLDSTKNLFKYDEGDTEKCSTLWSGLGSNNTLTDENGIIKAENVYVEGNECSESQLASLDISDLLYKEVTVKNISTDQIKSFIQNLGRVGTDDVSGGVLYNMLVGDDADDTTKAAWKNALAITLNRFTNHVSSVSESEEASEHNTLCTCDDVNSVSLNNIVSCLLTQFELNINGTDSGYYLSDRAEDSVFVTDDTDYLYPLNDSDAISDTNTLKADFYMQMYNNLCINGWTQNDKIAQNDYLDNVLKNGTYFITSMGDDNYFYQNRYDEADSVLIVKDDDAIAAAEAEFESQKAKLEYKEEKIDLEMKNLDLEISSLSTEYDSVKSLVSKNIEKIFAQFQ